MATYRVSGQRQASERKVLPRMRQVTNVDNAGHHMITGINRPNPAFRWPDPMITAQATVLNANVSPKYRHVAILGLLRIGIAAAPSIGGSRILFPPVNLIVGPRGPTPKMLAGPKLILQEVVSKPQLT